MRFKPWPGWHRTSKREAERFQIRRLRRYLAEKILPFSPFYRERLRAVGFEPHQLRSLDDLSRLPFTTKQDIIPSDANPEGPRRFILQPSPELIRSELAPGALLPILAKRLLLGDARLRADLLDEYNPVKMLFTTGRSASSVPFFLTRFDLAVLRETGRRIVEVLGLRPDHDKTVSLFPYAPHLAFWQVAACSEAAGILTLNTGGGRVMGGDRILDVIRRMRPTCVSGMPGYFYHILRKARHDGIDLPFIEKVALGGENVSPTLKGKIVDILRQMGCENPRVVSVYGFTEARQCWTECPLADDTGFHTSPDLSIVEIVDPDTGERLPDGATGELVYTTIEGRGSAIVRYRTGDVIVGGISWEPCPGCGRVLPRVMSSIQRASNVKTLNISKVKGTYINLNSLTALLEEEPDIEEWQIEISKPGDDPFEVDEIRLYCALASGTDAVAFIERTQRAVAALTEIHFNEIVIQPLDEMLTRVGMEESTKEVRVLDLRARALAGQETRP